MTDIILQEKSNAGNPHVRFDEGNRIISCGSPEGRATRGAKLRHEYPSTFRRLVVLGGMLMVLVGMGTAADFVWNETSAGLWDEETQNWLTGGNPSVWLNGNRAVFGEVGTTASVSVGVAARLGGLDVKSGVGSMSFDAVSAEDSISFILSGSRTLSTSRDVSFANLPVKVSGSSVLTSSGWLPPEDLGCARFPNVDLADVQTITGTFGIYVSLTRKGFGPIVLSRTSERAVFQYQYVGTYSSGSGYEGYVEVTLVQDGLDVVAFATKWGNRKFDAGAESQIGIPWEWTARDGIDRYTTSGTTTVNYGVSFKDVGLQLYTTSVPASVLTVEMNDSAAESPVVTFGDLECDSSLVLKGVALRFSGETKFGCAQALSGPVTFADGSVLDLGPLFAFSATKITIGGALDVHLTLTEKPEQDVTLFSNVAAGADRSRIRVFVNGIDVSSGLSLSDGSLTVSRSVMIGAIAAGGLTENEMLWAEKGDGAWNSAICNWMSAESVGIPWSPGKAAVFGLPGTRTAVSVGSIVLADMIKITGDMDGLAFTSSTDAAVIGFLRSGRATVSTAQDISFANAGLILAGEAITNSIGYLPRTTSGDSQRFANVLVKDIKAFTLKHGFSVRQTYHDDAIVEDETQRTESIAVFQYQWTKRSSGATSGGYEGYVNIRFVQDGLEVHATADRWAYRKYDYGSALPRGEIWDFDTRSTGSYYKYTDKDPSEQWQSISNLTLALKDVPLAQALTFRKEGEGRETPTVKIGSGVDPNGLPIVLDGVDLVIGFGQSVRVGADALTMVSGGPLSFEREAGLTFAVSYSEADGWNCSRLALPGLLLPDEGKITVTLNAEMKIRAIPPTCAFVLTSGAGLSASDLARFSVRTSGGVTGYAAVLSVVDGELVLQLNKRGLVLIVQ